MTPLAATLRRLDTADPYCNPVAGEPQGARWTRVRDALDDPSVLRGWFDGLHAESKGAADVRVSYLAGWLGGILLEPIGWVLGAERRAWPLDADSLWVHRHDDGWFDGFAVEAPVVRVLPDDPDAEHPDVVVVADIDALRAAVAREAVALLGPLFATIRTFGPFGIRGMWGAAADALGASAAGGAFRTGAPERSRAAFDDAMRLVDELTVAGAGRITRPVPEAITYSRGTTIVAHKGTCCLWYKTTDPSAPIGERYCLSCPLQPDPAQRDRWVAWLEEESAAAEVAAGTAGEQHSVP